MGDRLFLLGKSFNFANGEIEIDKNVRKSVGSVHATFER